MSSTAPTSVIDPAPEAPAVLDIEASGFGRDSYPIEIGFVLPDGQSYCSLIRPIPAWTHWDPAAERLHRIPLTTVIRHGREVVEVAAQLNARLHGLTVYCDGWAHDYTWLGVLFDAAGMSPSFRLDNLRALLTDREAAFWAIVKRQVTTEMRLQRHRASADARILQHTLMRLRGPLTRRAGRPAAD
ncbi:MAG: hypothetical protein V4540_13695 [Pseudomonadota bacterium]